MSMHAPQAWLLISGDEETSALEHPWPEPREGDVRFVIDGERFPSSWDARLELYRDLGQKMLAVFRELLPEGAWLYALDFHHASYRLFPHVLFEQGATPPPFTSRWPVAIHPDGDPEHWFAPPDFRFVCSARYTVETTGVEHREVESYELRGRELVEAVERHLPELFRLARRIPVTE